MCGMPGGGDDDVGLPRSSAARSMVPVWARTTVALTSLRVSSSPSGRPMVTPRPTTSTRLPASSMPWRMQQLHAAVGGARQRRVQRPAHVEHQPAQVHRVQAVGVLGRDRSPPGCVGVDVLGQRQLHDVAGAGRIRVQLVDDRQQFLLRGGRPAGRGGWTRCPPRRSPCACRPRTTCCPGPRPTSTVPRPGTMPLALSDGDALGQFGS